MDDSELTEEQRYKKVMYELGWYAAKSARIAEAVGTEWQHEAACASSELPPDAWWPPTAKTREDWVNIQKATNICFNECPVRETCLKAACAGKEKAGIWGGLSGDTRRASTIPSYDFDVLVKLPNPYENRKA